MSACKDTANELIQYLSLCGKLLHLGNGVLPQDEMALSLMQQRLGRLTVAHLADANKMVDDPINIRPHILYQVVDSPHDVVLCTFSDAAHPRDRVYGQRGLLVGII